MTIGWKPRSRRIALWLGGAILLYALLGFVVAPPIVRHELEKNLSGLLGRQVTVESVRINPFALTASVRGLAVKEPDGAADFAGFEDLSVNVTWSSLFRLGVVVESLSLTKPYVRVARLEDKKYSFQDIVDRFANAPPAPPGPPKAAAPFAVYNIKVSDGRVEFDDRPAKTRHAVTDIQVGLPFVSSLPKEVDIVVQPRLAARIDGAEFEIAGETKPFKDTHETTLRIDIDNLEIAKYLEYAPVPLRIKVPSGTLTTRLVLKSTAVAGERLQTLGLSGTATLQRVAIRQADGSPLAALARASVELESLDFLQRRAAIKSVRIEAPELDLVREKDGRLNLQAAFPAQPAAAPAEPGEPFAVTIGDIALLGGQFRFADRTTDKPVRVALNDISMAVEGLSSAPESRADVKLTARVNRTAPVEIAGKVNLLSKDLFAELTATERDIDLLPMSPYSAMYAGYAIAKGRLTLKHVIKLQARRLGTENSIRLEQFTFGERVDSPTATKLPVALALAVLKDRDGVVALDLPIAAHLDDPDVGSGKVIGREAGGLIGKAANEPFSLLGGEELAYLEFAPGSAALDAAAEAKLKTLAKALYDRPGLKLDVGGRVDPEADGAELKRIAAAKAPKQKEEAKEGSKPAAGPAIQEEDLRLLAQARAQAARDWLVGNGKLPVDRVSLAAPKLSAEGIQDKGRPTRVEFVLK